MEVLWLVKVIVFLLITSSKADTMEGKIKEAIARCGKESYFKSGKH